MLQKSMKDGDNLVASAMDNNRPSANIPCKEMKLLLI